MHKIDGPGATADNEFTEGNPAQGIPATTVTDDWLNTIQRELVAIVQAAGIDLDKANNAQVLAAIEALMSAAAPSATTSRAGLVELATAAEVEGGTDAVRAITPAALYSLGARGSSWGWVKLPGRILIQSMRVFAEADTSTFTWPIAFASPPWSISATDDANNLTGLCTLGATDGNSSTTVSVFSRKADTGTAAPPSAIFLVGIGPY